MMHGPMPSPSDDIVTPGLNLRLMGRETVDAGLAGDLARAEHLLDAKIPGSCWTTLAASHTPRLDWSATFGFIVGLILTICMPSHAMRLSSVTKSSRNTGGGYAAEASGAAMNWAQATFGV